MTELNNKQQQQERGIQRNRQGSGDAFADSAGSWWDTGRRFQMAEAAEGKDLTTTAAGLKETGRG